MADLALQGLVKRFGEVTVVERLDLQVEGGEFIVLLGESGCGKSTTLRMIAGLEVPTAGRVLIGGRDVTDLHPMARDIAMVFQSYALYPHMNVAKNLSFALRLAGRPRDEIERRVNEAARILNIENLLDRKPRALSGGQRQRVAIGRAIVREPQIFLFDEPLSNLDAKLRGHMRTELAQLHERLGKTTVYVTHDQVEAMTLASRIVIFDKGRIQQVGTPAEVFDTPANRFVATFVGTPTMNMLAARAAEAGRVLVGEGFRLPAPAWLAASPAADGRPLAVGIRPQALTPAGDAGSSAGFAAGSGAKSAAMHLQVAVCEFLGNESQIIGTLSGSGQQAGSGQRLAAVVDGNARALLHTEVPLTVQAEHVHVFDPDDGRNLRPDSCP